jgi:hypothetical protein
MYQNYKADWKQERINWTLSIEHEYLNWMKLNYAR